MRPQGKQIHEFDLTVAVKFEAPGLPRHEIEAAMLIHSGRFVGATGVAR